MKLLEAYHISHRFDYPLFDDISLSLEPRESIAITGVSGSGKSTLLHICSTLLQPQKGVVKLFGKDIYHQDSKELLEVRRKFIGIIFQSHYLFKGFSAFENIEVAALLARTHIDEALLKAFRIDRVIHKRVTELSGGEQQRVSIARVLTKRPKILFADEPTGNLDKRTASEVMGVVFEYLQSHDAALFLVTHDLELAGLCRRAYKLDNQNLTLLEHTSK